MRIGIVALAVTAEGGLTYLQNLVPALQDSGHELIVYMNPVGAQRLHVEQRPGSPPVRVRAFEAARVPLRRLLWERTRLAAEMRADRLDAALLTAPSVPRRLPCRAVAVVQNMEPYCEQRTHVRRSERIRLALLRRLTKKAMKRAAHVIFLSHANEKELIERTGVTPRASSVIYHGLDPAFSIAEHRHAIADEPFLLYVSKTRSYKRHLDLIEAVDILRRRHDRREHLYIVGEQQEPYASAVRARIEELGLSDVVRLAGEVPQEELPGWYSSCAAFIFPSTCEACPLIVIEALASGAPCCVARTAVLEEIAGDGAVYFTPADPSDMADRINSMLSGEHTADALSEKGRERASLFSWSECASATLAVLTDPAHPSGTRPTS